MKNKTKLPKRISESFGVSMDLYTIKLKNKDGKIFTRNYKYLDNFCEWWEEDPFEPQILSVKKNGKNYPVKTFIYYDCGYEDPYCYG